MLDKLGNFIEKKPWIVIGLILMITIGASTLIPFLDMGTSTEDFMPDDEIVKANQRVTDYFGVTEQLIMIHVNEQNSESTITPNALKEEYKVVKELEKIKEVAASISFANYVNIVCMIELNKTITECTNDEINIAIRDLFSEKNLDKIKMMNVNDPNEKIDYNLHNFFRSLVCY